MREREREYLLILRSMIDTTLHDATTMSVCSNLDAMFSNGIIDELVVARRETVEAALDDVVAVEVLDEFDDTRLERLDNELHLRRRREALNHLLHSAGAVHILGDRHEVGCHLLDNHQALLIVTVLEQLLAEVVAKRIYQSACVSVQGTNQVTGGGGSKYIPVMSSTMCS